MKRSFYFKDRKKFPFFLMTRRNLDLGMEKMGKKVYMEKEGKCIHFNKLLAYIVNEGKKTHFLLNFTLNKIKLAQIMNNRVYFVCNTCYFDAQ